MRNRKSEYALMSVKFSNDKNFRSWKHYCWIGLDGDCFTSREVTPIGFLPATMTDLFKGFNCRHLRLLGFKYEKTKMSQEELSKGWLCR